MNQKFSLKELRNRLKQNWPEVITADTDFILGIIRLNEIVSSKTNEITAQFNLTPAGFETLVTLRSLPSPRQLTPNDLMRSVLITSGGMTKVLHQLEADGWIERIANKSDQRSKLVKLTPAGKILIEDCMAAVMNEDQNWISQSFTRSEIKKIRNVLLSALEKLE